MTDDITDIDFTYLRYAQCWEDADILLNALDLNNQSECLSIASAGENTFSLLSKAPKKVIAIDLNPAQLACVDIKRQAYLNLSYEEFLKFIGIKHCSERNEIFNYLKKDIEESTNVFFQKNPAYITNGLIYCGKFEKYLRFFSNFLVPLINRVKNIQTLFQEQSKENRVKFYQNYWYNYRWRLIAQIFFSKALTGKYARDSKFYQYVDKNITPHLLQRIEYQLTELNAYDNPYLQWFILGKYQTALPHAFRKENFVAIKNNIKKLELRMSTIENFVQQEITFTALNLSNIFEYMSNDAFQQLLSQIARISSKHARIAYWNLFAQRIMPTSMSNTFDYLHDLSAELFKQDKAIFYSKFIILSKK